MSSGPPAKKISFGPFEVTSQNRTEQNRTEPLLTQKPKVFLTTPHSFALVNLKPLLPGHVLVCPSRPHKRLTDLSLPEVTDLFATVQRVQRMLARHYFAHPGHHLHHHHHQQQHQDPAPAPAPGGSFNIAVQDGPEAGQTVAHVHVHVIPRVRGLSSKPEDTAGDELYERMAREEGNVGGALWDRRQQQQRQSGSARPVAGGAFDRIEDSQREARSMEEMVAEADVFRRAFREMEEEEEEGAGPVGGEAS
ncbi:putative bis(5adenosyl)-triphosphatase [Diaporthe ampelina]|uniref:Bis(5'-adenosyl)-triphosphatase n=1 Tax=Diaporthe ampelina TaxID=1214573 RepID=A0A0G2FTQ0_9PEZI|nr:putative bis(5adenosyl)-triphosphatase [Diaporthe ampelina]